MNSCLNTTGVETSTDCQKNAIQANRAETHPVGPSGAVWEIAKQERNWLVYRLEAKANGKPGKMNKLPVDAETGQQVGKDEAAKLTFAEAAKACKAFNTRRGIEANKTGAWGLGYLPRPGSAMVGGDIDEVLNDQGELHEWARGLIANPDSYLEWSPSQNGFRVLMERQPGDEAINGAERNGVGLFADGKKFFTSTGQRIGSTGEITEASGLRERLLERRELGSGGTPMSMGPKAPSGPSSGAQRATRGKWYGIPPERRAAALTDALRYIRYNDREHWIKISAAVHSAISDLGEDVARAIWDDWCNEIGGPTDENDKTWNSFSSERAGGVSVATVFAKAKEHGWNEAKHVFGELTLAAMDQQAEPERTATLEALRAIESATTGAQNAKHTSTFFPASQLHGQAIPPRKWLVEDLVPLENVTMLYGDGGTGKSLLALQLAVATASGKDWVGQDVHSGSALFISAEDDVPELHRRLALTATGSGLTLQDLDRLTVRSLAGEDAILGTFDPAGRLAATGLFAEIEAQVLRDAPALIVLDTLNDLYAGDENDKSQARQFIGLLRGLAIQHNCAVVLLAHPSKSGMSSGSGDSGSVAWSNSARSRLYLSRDMRDGYEPDPDARILTTMKANYGPKGGALGLRYQRGVFVPTGGCTGAGTSGLNGGENITDKAKRVFVVLLRQFNANGFKVNASSGPNYAPKQFAEHPDSEGVQKAAFKQAMYQLMSDGAIRNEQSGPPSKRVSQLVLASSPPGGDQAEGGDAP
ncbi:AAA family ATPase [Salibaculum griseiflavum]|uniref:AAA+ ATPase domain-containing protein n=1 Tax=Salibaculum griseiflavum TaxID=1914409 RepID=A0A2V1P1L2_9RHOB|nr:AAA family ATPase [Salibaculum griseiflavum]PWG16335.1 hypothetical protein DFK10_11870 [Salibaculum griseiflavum]